ncbi:MAG: hypothetical protein DMF03_09685 [Verrucomicrobia bacterium]|nr:MAG: hypothetical protein DMF03_09685 [Verrucomicrobiota bacterium]
MSSTLFRAGVVACGIALLLVCSCEEHHLGEYPEVQRDRLYEAQHHADPAARALPSATPVNFFPENKSPSKSP